ncbi:putative transmembrane protein [Rhodopirellula islandica]|uniref:Transmembrane protein n=1 Tax=Rhodopirellula islandica TaxID=595434 RepID=A0A0J1BJB1_RHOIS|nr:hypothetical protein [Rhodopirellula islandica]KLU06646.1 putative transmembrane protein [Rhodopirellula islandica]
MSLFESPLSFRPAVQRFVGGLWICFGLLVVSPAAVTAQGFGNNAAAGGANEVTSFRGKLVSYRGMILTIEREDGTEVMVQTPDSVSQLTFIAKALPAYLRPGMLVRFQANLGPTGAPLEPVSKLELFAPVNVKLLKGREREKFQPGVHPSNPPQRGNAGPPTGPVTVVGNLMALNPQGGVALRAGNVPVQTMTSPDLELQLRVNNLSLAQPGDAVDVRGFYQPPDDTKVKAESIQITTDRVYGETPPPTERRSRRSKRGERDKDEAAEAENADEASSEEGRSLGIPDTESE